MPGRLEDLQLLVAVVRYGTLTAAAAHTGTTQSRVSRALKRLEDDVGRVLVRRSSRQVAPTEAGRRLASEAVHAIERIDAVRSELQTGQALAGRLRLSTPPAVGRRVLSPVIQTFCQSNPGIRLDWSLGSRRVDVIAEDVDLAIRFGPLAPTWQRAIRLMGGRYAVFGSPTLLGERELTAAQLPTWPTIGLHTTHLRDRWPVYEAGQLQWINVDPQHWVDDAEALITLTLSGLGLALVPDILVCDEVAKGHLRLALPLATAVPFDLYAVLGPHRPLPRAEALVDHFRRHL
ncbi:MAG: LysR substrate-binding domain-containing protein [Myxococcota bacterium]